MTTMDLTPDEKKFVAQYVSLIDLAPRIAEAVQNANGDRSYISEKLDAIQIAAGRLNDIIGSKDLEIPGGPRELAAAFSRHGAPVHNAFDDGPTVPVPAGFADPGKIRAAVAAQGWDHSLARAAHPVKAIEDRFADVRERARTDQFQRHPEL
jgi:hypothetical protein